MNEAEKNLLAFARVLECFDGNYFTVIPELLNECPIEILKAFFSDTLFHKNLNIQLIDGHRLKECSKEIKVLIMEEKLGGK